MKYPDLCMNCDRSISLLRHRTNGQPDVAVAPVPVHAVAVAVEAEEVCVAVEAPVGRARPIVAAGTSEVERRAKTVARSRQEDALAILPRHLVAIMPALRGPCPSTLVFELLYLRLGGHPPRATPVGSGGIILWVTTDVTHLHAISFAITYCIFTLGICSYNEYFFLVIILKLSS